MRESTFDTSKVLRFQGSKVPVSSQEYDAHSKTHVSTHVSTHASFIQLQYRTSDLVCFIQAHEFLWLDF